ncbi:MAG TPA: hypothetical protein VEI07_09450 [Planctomycetaceae bacterium]|nr:hypothetical protein [Planctomycetaceae bacterium]
MAANCWPILLSAVLGAGPVAPGAVPPAPATPAGVAESSTVQGNVVSGNVIEMAGAPCEARFPFDYPAPWLHGYVQENPAHGFHFFRPYNYKQVLAHSEIATGWGLSPASPYGQHYWDRPRPTQATSAVFDLTGPTVVPTGAWELPPGLRR